MAYTYSQLTDLENAISKGVTTLQLNGRRVEYRSLAEMERLRDSIKAELGVSTPKTSRSRVINIMGGKGL
mgnify:CR=1 FL=1